MNNTSVLSRDQVRPVATPDVGFRAAPGLGNPHVQILVSRAARARARSQFRRTRLDTPDGDFIDLDIWVGPDKPGAVCLLVHGLEGSSHSGYMVTMSAALEARGVQAVALNFRSCSGEPNRTVGSYHSGRTDDIVRALAWIASNYTELPIGAVGFSLGGNALLNLLGRSPRSGVGAAAAISVPYDLGASSRATQRGLARGYAYHFLRTLRRKAREKAERFPGAVAPEGARASTLWEFDDLVTAPVHGFRDAQDYYDQCSAARHVPNVEVPTLLVQSSDDPLVPAESVPVDQIRARPNLTLHMTSCGGHVGFMDRRLGVGPNGWLEQNVAGYLARSLGTRPQG